jgi:hypothetical protein
MMLGRSLLALALVLFVMPVAAATRASAQSDEGEIDLVVVDAANGEPLGDARTFLFGAQTANALTNASGSIKFTDVPVGIYRVRITLRGYDGASTREFDVLPNRAVHMRFQLSKRSAHETPENSGASSASTSGNNSNLRVIATVTARAKVSITTTDVKADSPIRRLSDSLTDALDKLAGVSVTTDATDPTSAVQISLHNQDESQTALTLDGIPLSAPGAAGNLRSIGTDLFAGSQVSFSPTAGGLAGGVNFSTLQPTQALQIRASGTTGTYDRSNYLFAATGSVDKLGFVLEHTWRGANSPLTFRDYEDQSGLTYAHGGESTSLSDLVKLRYAFGDERTSISATALDTNRNAYAVCAQDVTVLPCGIGPGNRTFERYGMAYATVQSLIGNVQTNFSAYANSSATVTDDLNRYVLTPNPLDPSDPAAYEPTLDPSLSNGNTVTRGVAYSASLAQGNHTFTLVGNTYAAMNESVPVIGSQYVTPFTNAASSTRFQFSDTIKSNDRLTLTPSVSFADTSGLGGSVLAGISSTWTPATADAYALSVSVGSSQPNLGAMRSFSDPVSARFNCQAQTAVVGGAGDTGEGQKQSATAITAAWTHRFRTGASLSLDAYSQVQSGQLINALIDEPASYFNAAGSGYLQTLYAAYRSPTVCGLAAPTPTVYAQESVAGTRRIYQGLDFTGRFALSPYIEILPTYSLNVALLSAAGPRLADGPSTTIVGAQLPNRPLHKGGLTIDGLLPRSGLELLASVQYVGANNQQNLGPYADFSFGASHRLGAGELTLFINNTFNAYAGEFATDAFARPLPLSDGNLYYAAATPLTPRTIFLSYAVAVGGPAPGPSFRQFARAARVAAPQPTPTPSANPRGFRRFTSNPPPPGVDPLSLATARPTCDADARTAAKPTYDAFRAYVAAFESGSTTLPDVPQVTVVPHKASADSTVTYYLELRPNLPRPPGANQNGNGPGLPRGGRGGFGPPGAGGEEIIGQSQPQSQLSPQAEAARRAFANSPAVKAYRAFVGCAYVTILSAADAKAKEIATGGGRPGLLYIPKIGIVFVQPFELPQGGGSLRREPQPSASPGP